MMVNVAARLRGEATQRFRGEAQAMTTADPFLLAEPRLEGPSELGSRSDAELPVRGG